MVLVQGFGTQHLVVASCSSILIFAALLFVPHAPILSVSAGDPVHAIDGSVVLEAYAAAECETTERLGH